MKALVTGAAGFIGARLVESLRADGHDVFGVDELHFFTERAEHLSSPLLTPQSFGPIESTQADLHAWRPDVVFHLGACSDTTVTDWDFVKRMNLTYSQRLWESCRAEGVPFFYASSAATYGDGAHGYDDDESQLEHLAPLNLYGRSKHEFDRWALEQDRLGLAPPRWAGFKFFNVYGFGERHKGRMASVALHAFDQIRNSGRVQLFASDRPGIPDGGQMRDFIAVEDVCSVLRWAQTEALQRGVFNLGTGQARTFCEFTEAVFHALALAPNIDYIPMPLDLRARYQYFTQANMNRLRQAGYRNSFMGVDEGVARYVRRLLS